MRPDAATKVLAIVAVLAASAVVVASLGTSRAERAATASREFQRLVGGLGLGPSIDVAHCTPAFDPRVGATCRERVGPVPAGDAFSAEHAAARVPAR